MDDSNTEKTFQARAGNLAWGGAFVCTTNPDDPVTAGKKAFIRETAPCELVEAALSEEHRGHIEARLLRVIEESSERVSPPCPLFGDCGGCDLQHISINAQRLAKLEMIRSAIRLHSGCTPEKDIRLIGENLPAYQYRNRIALHVSPAGEIGFFRQKSGEVVALKSCLLASDAINKAIESLLNIKDSIAPAVGKIALDEADSKTYAVFMLRETFQPDSENIQQLKETIARHFPRFEISDGRDVLESNMASENDELYPAGHFAQVNDAGNIVLIEHVLGCLDNAEVLDLYAGAGNFSIPLARLGRKVTAVEIDPALVSWGEKLACNEKLSDKLRFVKASCERYLRENKAPEAVLLDPPRSGAKALLQHFRPERTRKIVYVSCNLPALTRDLRTLKDNGYRLRSVSVLDMFSQTHHVETISLLEA